MEKILVASSGNTLDSKVSGRFGHAACFLIVDPETMDYQVFQGVSKDESPLVSKYIQAGINKVIVGNIGPATFDELRACGYKIYLCRNMQVDEAVSNVHRGEIQPMDAPTLQDSIHSARKSTEETPGSSFGRRIEDGFRRIFSSGAGRGAGSGMGSGMGRGSGRGSGKGMGGGSGRGSGKGMGGGTGKGRRG